MTTDPLAELLHVHHIGCLEAINGQKPLTGDDQRTHDADAARLRAAGVTVEAHPAESAASLRSPRNSLGKLAVPEGLMERAVEAAWEGVISPVGDPADGIEMHDLSDLADGICDYLDEHGVTLASPEPAPPKDRQTTATLGDYERTEP